ncbi:MAG: DUF928 domain-containing protein [Microcoleaceae cyanobacterium MO_207.B10]|nr:DUF928 domain-containing protein [Microcoleaceae cyanobacterium MO_207.B10]
MGLLVSPTTVNLSKPISTTQIQSHPQTLAVKFPPGGETGAPARTRGAGSRGPCNPLVEEKSGINLTALMPKNNIGTTVSPNPNVYLYVPKTSKKTAEFVLYDWTNRVRTPIYKTNISLPDTSGILKVDLPKTVELQPDNIYVWHFGIICDPSQRSLDYYINGWLKRTSLTTETEAKLQQLEQKPLEKAQLYAESSVWNETISILEKARDAYPNAWKELLESVGLEEIADSKIFDCCQKKSAQR